MARGIERRRIFVDDEDRRSFLRRLSVILPMTGTRCLAFSGMPNHYHLLLETGATPLSRVMLRIGTCLAMDFNRRHDRVGHLFQNRFKSRLVEGDGDLIGVVRYIHLNPVRAGIVASVPELASHPWTGHAALMGRRRAPFLDASSVLRYFADDPATARRELARWMQAGLGEDEVAPDFDGREGGLPPSAPEFATVSRDRYAGELEHIRLRAQGWDLERVIEEVCAWLQVDPRLLREGRRTAHVSRAREAVAFLAAGPLGESQMAVARATGVSGQAISRAVDRVARWPAVNREPLHGLLRSHRSRGGPPPWPS